MDFLFPIHRPNGFLSVAKIHYSSSVNQRTERMSLSPNSCQKWY